MEAENVSVENLAVILAELRSRYQMSEADTVRSPGRMEGEHVSTLYFDSKGGECADSSIGDVDVFDVTAVERKVFGWKNDVEFFTLSTSDQGFVYGVPMTAAGLETLRQSEEDAGDPCRLCEEDEHGESLS